MLVQLLASNLVPTRTPKYDARTITDSPYLVPTRARWLAGYGGMAGVGVVSADSPATNNND